MPPLLAVIPALIAGGAGVAGAVEGAQAGGRQQKALTQQEQIAQQEMADKQAAFKQLTDFFAPYLKEGSPFLQMIQRSAAETNATGANNAAGAVRGGVERSGMGYGPSGTEAAALGGVATEAAKTGSSNYLQNLLANEQVKFQAAQGIQGAGQMVGSPQNQPNVSAQLPYQSTGSGLTGLAQVLQGILNNTNTNQVPTGPSTAGGPLGPIIAGGPVGTGTIPPPGAPPQIPGVPGPSGTPTTQGWTM
jgi:hypothetical protein